MPFRVVSERVDFVKDVHKSVQLSELIQREVRDRRFTQIVDYLTTEEDRFFNSLVLAVYSSKPEWFPTSIASTDGPLSVDQIPEECRGATGYLKFSGTEKIIAIDGQHRLAGIKEVVLRNPKVTDCISVVFVAHDPDVDSKRIKTRRLFTALNKHVKAVDKFEIISLDENDLMAIVTRRLIEEHKWFMGERIQIKAGSKIDNQSVALTTIDNLYDLLTVLFSRVFMKQLPDEYQSLSAKALKAKLQNGSDPKPVVVDLLYGMTVSFFQMLASKVQELSIYFNADPDSFGAVATRYRREKSGCIFFRPVGLNVLIKVLASLTGTVEERISVIASFPRYLTQFPYKNTIWSPDYGIDEGQEPSVRNLLLHSLGVRLGVTQINSAVNGWSKITGTVQTRDTLPSNISEIFALNNVDGLSSLEK